ncbi:hypothetical protein ACUSIJ_21000 [Pseudochelatococcus sp. B33]
MVHGVQGGLSAGQPLTQTNGTEQVDQAANAPDVLEQYKSAAVKKFPGAEDVINAVLNPIIKDRKVEELKSNTNFGNNLELAAMRLLGGYPLEGELQTLATFKAP